MTEEEKPKYTQEEVDDLLRQALYKNACYEAVRAMEAFGSPKYLIQSFVLNNPVAFPPPVPINEPGKTE